MKMFEKHDMPADRFEVRPTAESHFSWLRTRLSVERTLMSWVRTSVALIGFGFSIFKLLEQGNHDVRAAWYLGLSMIGAGTVAMLIATWQYRWGIRYLWGPPFNSVAGIKSVPGHTPLFAVAILLILVGIFAFLAVLLKFR
jgi:putative membrane protein